MKLIAISLASLWIAFGAAQDDWSRASSGNGEVCLELPEGLVDWRALAIADFGKARFEHPSRSVLRSGLQPEAGNSAEVKFESAVPAAVSSRSWTVIYRDGSAPVRPTVLRGSVVYFVNSRLALTRAPVAEGTACAPWAIAQSAAFFTSGATVRQVRVAESSVTRSGTDTFAITLDGHATRFARPDFTTAGVSHVTIFQTDRQETLALIDWDHGDGSTCGHAFTLLTLTPAGSRVPLENGYDCDV